MTNRIGDNLIHVASNEGLVRSLVNNDVKFIVVGGLAMSWHCSARTADDMDLLIEPTAVNSERVSRALTGLGQRIPPGEVFGRLDVQVPLKAYYYAELLTPSTGGIAFSDAYADSVDARLFSIPVRVASMPTLVAMKKKAVSSTTGDGLAKHLRDLHLLKSETQ